MDTLIQANIFFFISSVSTVVVSIVVVILIIKIIKLANSLNLLVDKLKNAGDYVSDEAKGLVEDIKQSPIFRLIFPRRKRSSSSHKEILNPSKKRRKV